MKILNKKKNLPEEKYPKEMLLNLYRTMVRIRSFEEHAAECFTKGMLAGNIHLSIGQEGAEAGAFAGLFYIHSSWSRSCDRARRGRQARDGGAVRQGDRLLQR